MTAKQKLKENAYYIIVAGVSLVVLTFFPLLGSQISGAFQFPTTAVEWLVWLGVKVAVVICSLLIFGAFVKAGKANIANDERYLAAAAIAEKKALHVQSPTQFYASIWTSKGATTIVTTLLSTFVIAEAVLTYDYAALIAYTISIVSSVAFGVMTMLDVEQYWTIEFPIYINQNGGKTS